ncbi:MAG TPA: sigma-70 family RNA polymerase sigma factor [Verrucomicrobiae bacterium]|nr:sigma-70 family RNA polymerase sigma factor [Verrucomicrobiae bacterium]
MSSVTMEEPQPVASSTPVRSPGAAPGDRGSVGLAIPELAAIYEENCRPIYYLALRMLGDPTQAEDATHDVFLKAYRKLGEFKGQSTIRTWLYRITINHCQNLLQTWHRRHIQTTDDEELWERTAGASESPLRILETRELGQRIQKTLQAIPEEYRLLLLLVADEKLSYDEIGTLTSQTSDAVRGKLHRARKAFAAHFRKTA